MKMKKNYWFVMLAMVFVFASCENGSDVDARDAFVGIYSYTSECHLNLKDPQSGQESPMNFSPDGSFQIVKKGKKDSVLIVGPIAMVLDSIEAVVKGNQLEIVNSEFKMDYAAMGTLLTISLKNLKAPMSGDSLKWDTDFTCEGSVFFQDVIGDGYLHMNAKKVGEIDERDAFVGTYDYQTEGELTRETKVTIPGFDPALPLTSEGTFTISKLGTKDSVLIEGAFNGKIAPFKGVIEGKNLRVVQNQFTATGSTFEVSLTVDNTVIPMVDNTLTWKADEVKCEGTLTVPVVGEIQITGTGHVQMTATKK